MVASKFSACSYLVLDMHPIQRGWMEMLLTGLSCGNHELSWLYFTTAFLSNIVQLPECNQLSPLFSAECTIEMVWELTSAKALW